MATISFHSRDDTNVYSMGGSGLGFYGNSGFGASVAVGSYQGRTFITDSTGTDEGPEVNNNKYDNTSGVIIGQTGSPISLLELPNYLSTLNIRFTHSSAVEVSNAKLYIYDRSSYTNDPSGVTAYAAEVSHTNTVQDYTGVGDANWQNTKGTTYLSLGNSPGISGTTYSSPAAAVRHDWYVALSVTPTSVGAKEFAALFSMEYL